MLSLRSDIHRIKDICQFYALEHEVTLSAKLIDFYQTLAWPGNLRQLLGHLDKKKVLTKSRKLDFDHLDEELLLQSSDLMKLNGQEQEIIPIEDIKLNYIKRAVALCDGNVAMAARKLQLNQKTVRGFLQKD
jgi:DNA-binding NtrC family response regulator